MILNTAFHAKYWTSSIFSTANYLFSKQSLLNIFAVCEREGKFCLVNFHFFNDIMKGGVFFYVLCGQMPVSSVIHN